MPVASNPKGASSRSSVAISLLGWKQSDEVFLRYDQLTLKDAVAQGADEAEPQRTIAANIHGERIADRRVQHVLQRRGIGNDGDLLALQGPSEE